MQRGRSFGADIGLGETRIIARWVSHVVARIRRRFLADHVTITSGWFTKAFAGHRHFYVNVACAPSRRHQWELDPRAAHRFVERVFPDAGFPENPTQAFADQVSFEIADETHRDPMVRAIRVYANGLVELTWRLPLVRGHLEEGAVLSVGDIVGPILRLASAANDGAYAGLFSRWPRLDWFVSVSPSVNHDRGWSPWADLEFPGARPEGRATRHYPNIPALGYGADHLRKLSQRTTPNQILKVTMEDMLRQCGFFGISSAIKDTLRTV